ncbi:MAG: hypothetical protein QOJ29_1236, partial [Thermoleophilaceae bacterium]|nr:hypothetical protein [Thermoleophilaceae bacterium]
MTWTRTVRRAAPRLLTILVLVLLSLPASASAAGWAGIAPVTGDPGGGRSISQPKIATDPAGNQAVMWIEGPSPFKIVAAFRPTGGAWGAAQVLNSGSSTAVSDIAADGAGNFIVVYGHSNGAIQQAFSNYLASGTTTFGAQQLAGSFTSTQVPL